MSDLFLKLCAETYEEMTRHAEQVNARRPGGELALRLAASAATFASMHHPGRFADRRLDRIAAAVRAERPSPRTCVPEGAPGRPDGATRRVLHVLTLAPPVGGHVQTIVHWITTDAASHHSVVLTQAPLMAVSEKLQRTLAECGGGLWSVADCPSWAARVHAVRRLADQADLVVLHQNPDDLVAVAAFSENGGPPVAILNHADHIFWAGSSIADVTIQLRPASSVLDARRFTRRTAFLPIPLRIPGRVDRGIARARLGIPPGDRVLLSVGRSAKYVPTVERNFFRAMHLLLEREPTARVFVVGPTETDHSATPGFVSHARLHLLGPMTEIDPYHQAADLYVEGFPFGSQTALLEAAAAGLPVVVAPRLGSPLLATCDASLEEHGHAPESEEAYVDCALAFLNDPDLGRQTGDALRSRMIRDHSGDGWRQSLDALYRLAAPVAHSHADLPHVAPSFDDVDMAISGWHQAKYGPHPTIDTIRQVLHGNLFETAYGLRRDGHYSDALATLGVSLHNGVPALRCLTEAGKALAAATSDALRLRTPRSPINATTGAK